MATAAPTASGICKPLNPVFDFGLHSMHDMRCNAGGGGGGGGETKQAKGDAVREQDRLLPIANISRIMKRALPGMPHRTALLCSAHRFVSAVQNG